MMNPQNEYVFEENDVLYCFGCLDSPEIENQIMNALTENYSNFLQNFQISKILNLGEKSYMKNMSANITTIDEEAFITHEMNLDKILNNLEHRLRDRSEIRQEIADCQEEYKLLKSQIN